MHSDLHQQSTNLAISDVLIVWGQTVDAAEVCEMTVSRLRPFRFLLRVTSHRSRSAL